MGKVTYDEILKLKKKEIKARLKGLPSPLSEDEQIILKEWKAEHPTELRTSYITYTSIVSLSDDGVIHIPLFRPVEDYARSIIDDTKRHCEDKNIKK